MSLRSRLILTHILVILITFFIISVSLVFILRDYQRDIQLARLGDAVVPLAFQARTMLQSDVPPREALNRLEQQAEGVGRVMIVTERGQVIADAANGLVNRTVRLNQPITNRSYVWGQQTVRTATGDRMLLFAAIPAGKVNGQSVYIALAAIEKPIGSALAEIIPSLRIAGALTLVISILAALLLARSIAKPITALTRATEAFAAGHYEQRVPHLGNDEIGRLGKSFNLMAQRVQQSRQMERDLLADVSHELKTPLTSIQGFSQAILDSAVQEIEGARRAARTIYDETARMARLVGDLLTLARFESGETQLRNEKLDLGQLLPTWVERMRPNAAAQGQTLQATVGALPIVQGDAGRLEQVVTNLVDNALKYNHSGGSVSVSADAESEALPGMNLLRSRRRMAVSSRKDWVKICVTDTGSGISPKDLPHVFDRFFRGDKARAAGGTGLGLAIAQEIIAAHEGNIRVESELGKGSTFIVRLPAFDETSK